MLMAIALVCLAVQIMAIGCGVKNGKPTVGDLWQERAVR
jgi:hypothetical protein